MKAFLATAVLLGAATTALAQGTVSACTERHNYGTEKRACELRTLTFPATGSLNIDASENGGISVTGSARQDVEVRAEVDAWANSEAEARDKLQQIHIETDNGMVRAQGPSDHKWSVGYKISTPMNTNVTAKAYNGGVTLDSLKGELRAETTNGGVTLDGLSGSLKATTVNGGIRATLNGTQWDGSGADMSTTNGGIHLGLPAGFRAHLDASTENGGVHCSLPITATNNSRTHVKGDINGGGPAIRASTVNGGVDVQQK